MASKDEKINFQCIDAIKVSLCIEKEGLGFYERAAKQVQEPQVREIFTRLANEEKEHIQILQEKAKHLQPALGRKAEPKKIDHFINNKLKGRVFPTFQGKSPDLTEFTKDLEALDFGIASEERSISVLNELLEEEKKIDVRAIFLHLVAEEKRHLQALKELRDTLVHANS